MAWRRACPAELTFEIIQQGVDEIVLVSEEEITRRLNCSGALRTIWPKALAQLATAATFKLREQLRGKRVVNVMTGGNLDTDSVRRIFG
jgi:threonine dehydratase